MVMAVSQTNDGDNVEATVDMEDGGGEMAMERMENGKSKSLHPLSNEIKIIYSHEIALDNH